MFQELRNIRAVLFDAGNTLIFPDYEFLQNLLADFGINIELATLRDLEDVAKRATVKRGAPKSWKVYFGTWLESAGVGEKDLPELLQRLWQKHRRDGLWHLADEGLTQVLSELKKRRFLLGVVSNADGTLEQLLQELGLATYFHSIVDSELVGYRKPNPAIFEFALQQLQVSAEQALYVGDSYEWDVVGAENAGLKAILFDPLDKHPEYNCNRITTLRTLLKLPASP